MSSNIENYNVKITINNSLIENGGYNIIINVESFESNTIIPSQGRQCFQIGYLVFQYIPSVQSYLSPCALANWTENGLNPSSIASNSLLNFDEFGIYSGPELLYELDIGMTPCYQSNLNVLTCSNITSNINNFDICSENPNLAVNITIYNDDDHSTIGGAIGLGGKTGPTGNIIYNVTYVYNSSYSYPVQNSNGYIYFTYPEITYIGNNQTQNIWKATGNGLVMCEYISSANSDGSYNLSSSINSFNLFANTAGTILESCVNYTKSPSNDIVYDFMPCGTLYDPNISASTGGLFGETIDCAIAFSTAQDDLCPYNCMANCEMIYINS